MATIRFDTRFPGYEVLSELGRSNARVLKARHLATGDLVAIKHFALNTDAETLRRFQRESELMIRINHPNIVKIREVQLEAELPYIVMELIEGGTLKERIVNQGQIDIPTLIRIGLQMASAFSVIHSQGIVHRDVKPENILYRPLSSGELHFLLTDFGVARLHEQSHTLTGQSLMTYEYAAPEQFNNPKFVNVATDYYSLGVVLYECLYGSVPFALNDEAGIVTFMNRVLTETPPQLIESASSTEQGIFDELLQKLLHKNPAERLSDPDELIWLLKQAELAYLQARREGTIRTSKPIPPKQRIPNKPQEVNVASESSGVEEDNTRNATLGSWGWILLLAALLIGGGVYYVMNRSKKPVQIPAVDQVDTQSDAIDTLNAEADSSDEEDALRQQQEEEAQRRELQRQQALAAVDSLNVKVTDYNVGLLGGIKNVQLQLLNPSQFVFASVVVQVDYYKENGDLYKSEKVYFSPVEARSSLLKEAPNSDRGTRLTCQIISHQFEPAIDSLLAVPSDSVNFN